MKDKKPCPFCKSETILVDSPFVDFDGKPKEDWCCEAQKRNHEYQTLHFGADPDYWPDREDIEKL